MSSNRSEAGGGSAPPASVVLAGGLSSRMGRDKATLTLPGLLGTATLVEHTVDTVAQRCTPVFVVAAAGQVLPELAAEVLRDPVPALGPLPALALGLAAAAAAGADWAFVCAVDMPLLAPELIDLLVAAAAEGAAEVVLPTGERDHYLAALYRTALAERVDALVTAGERRMRTLVETVEARRVPLAPDRAAMLANLNSPADIAALPKR